MGNKQYFKFITLLCFLFFTGCHFNANPGKGSKIGKIVKLSQEGIFNKTWEGELIRGGLTDGSGTLGNTFCFTIEDESLLPIAFEAFENQYEVVLTYTKETFTSFTRSQCDSPAFVTKIQIKDVNRR